MNRPIGSFLITALLFNLAGCRHQPSAYTVCLLDVSKSITPEGLKLEFKSVDRMAELLERGDELTVIPISGNAMNDTSGHVLRFAAPTERQPYDHDLVVFRQKAHEQISALLDDATRDPAIRTDIFGTLDLVKEEFAAHAKNGSQPSLDRTLVIFSDFIEDDGVYRFTSEPTLASSVSAQAFAERVRTEREFGLDSIQVRLSAIESVDLRHLTLQRQRAIRAFWQAYIPQSSWDML
jgi:hypothetical protein